MYLCQFSTINANNDSSLELLYLYLRNIQKGRRCDIKQTLDWMFTVQTRTFKMETWANWVSAAAVWA